MLAEALPEGVVSLGRHVTGVDGASLLFEDGASAEFDAVIGADGIHSVVRAAIVGDESPEFTGLAAYRALVPAEEAPEFARRPVCSIWLGPRRHFVHYPVSGGSQVNLVTANPAGDWREESWTAPGEVADFLAEYEGWDEGVVSLIAAARETKRYAFYAREPVTRWVSGPRRAAGRCGAPDAARSSPRGRARRSRTARCWRAAWRGRPMCRRLCGATRRCASSAPRACSG